MISQVLRNIIIRAIHLRMEQNECLESILDSYIKLTDEDRIEILNEIKTHENPR